MIHTFHWFAFWFFFQCLKTVGRPAFLFILRKAGCPFLMSRKQLFRQPNNQTVAEIFERFVASQTAKGVSDKTIRNLLFPSSFDPKALGCLRPARHTGKRGFRQYGHFHASERAGAQFHQQLSAGIPHIPELGEKSRLHRAGNGKLPMQTSQGIRS